MKKWLSILVVLTIGAALLTAGCGEDVVTEEMVICTAPHCQDTELKI